MRKTQLIPLLDAHRPSENIFKADVYILSLGHSVVRLPPYMYDLNPIELAWAKVKHFVREHNCDGNLSLKRLEELAEEAINNVTAKDWENYCKRVQEIEDKYWEDDGKVSDDIDKIIINLGTESVSSDSDTDSEEELARPLE